MSELLLPGSVVCSEEEFGAGVNAKVDLLGQVIALQTGTASFDRARRIVHVLPVGRSVQLLQSGSIVLGRVVLVKENVAIVELLSGEKNGIVQSLPSGTAAILVSRMDAGFVKSARDKFRIGDILKAKVESVAPWGIDLTTAFSDLGVVKAFCVRCRSPLKSKGQELVCVSCGNLEQRKVSRDYVLRD